VCLTPTERTQWQTHREVGTQSQGSAVIVQTARLPDRRRTAPDHEVLEREAEHGTADLGRGERRSLQLGHPHPGFPRPVIGRGHQVGLGLTDVDRMSATPIDDAASPLPGHRWD